MSTEYNLWFGLSEESRRPLADLINKFSRRFNSPLFEPHITLLGGINAAREEVVKYANGLAQTVEPFDLELDGIGETENFFRCLFVRVKLNPPLIELYRRTVNFWGNSGYIDDYMPHISLVYGNLVAEDKQNVAQEVLLPSSRIHINEVQVVSTNADSNPEKWQVIACNELQGVGA